MARWCKDVCRDNHCSRESLCLCKRQLESERKRDREREKERGRQIDRET